MKNPIHLLAATRSIEKSDQPNNHTAPSHSNMPDELQSSRRTIISFQYGDPDNPINWSMKKKLLVVNAGILNAINGALGSSLPSGAINFIARTFGVTNQEQLVLPVSIYLVGFILGPMLCGPLSESFGRRAVLLPTFIIYTCFTLGCALAPDWPTFLVFRWLCGMAASAPMAAVPGLFADIYNEPRSRGRATALFMAATLFGPVLGPLASGYLSTELNWRWSFWFALILAGVTLPFMIFLPETYGPVLLTRKAQRQRKKEARTDIYAPAELQNKGGFRHMVVVVLGRPFQMLFQEAIVSFTCLYLSVAYAIFYLYFQAYPIIFQGPKSVYKMSPGVAGLAFLPIGVGASICAIIFLWYDDFLAKAQKRKAAWASIEEYRRLPLATVGGPLYVISLFWLGWSAYASVHWIVPMLSGVTFGMGFLLIFMAMLNYLTDAYETFAASAQAIASTSRSVFGALLPFAARPMYRSLGVHWATSLLAFLSLAMAIIPFAFIKYGDRIRASSRFCQQLKGMKNEEKERNGTYSDTDDTLHSDPEKQNETQ